MRPNIEQHLERSRAAMAQGATAQMDRRIAEARARRDDAATELDRLENAIDGARGHQLRGAASAYFQATRSRLPARADLNSLRTQHAMVEQAWETADYDLRRYGDAA